jgi:hypothetical protein
MFRKNFAKLFNHLFFEMFIRPSKKNVEQSLTKNINMGYWLLYQLGLFNDIQTLLCASAKGHLYMVIEILLKGIHPSSQSVASAEYNENIFNDLSINNVIVGRDSKYKQLQFAATPLIMASINGRVNVIKYLLKNPNLVPDHSLYYAVINNQLEAIKILLKNPRINQNPNIAFRRAIIDNKFEIVDMFLNENTLNGGDPAITSSTKMQYKLLSNHKIRNIYNQCFNDMMLIVKPIISLLIVPDELIDVIIEYF